MPRTTILGSFSWQLKIQGVACAWTPEFEHAIVNLLLIRRFIPRNRSKKTTRGWRVLGYAPGPIGGLGMASIGDPAIHFFDKFFFADTSRGQGRIPSPEACGRGRVRYRWRPVGGAGLRGDARSAARRMAPSHPAFGKDGSLHLESGFPWDSGFGFAALQRPRRLFTLTKAIEFEDSRNRHCVRLLPRQWPRTTAITAYSVAV